MIDRKYSDVIGTESSLSTVFPSVATGAFELVEGMFNRTSTVIGRLPTLR